MATYRGDGGSNVVDSGFDTLYGKGADDLLVDDRPRYGFISGGSGDDYLTFRPSVGSQRGKIVGGTGDDSIFGSRNTDHLAGDGGNDFIAGIADFDISVSYNPEPTTVPIPGRTYGDKRDIIHGGSGIDALYGFGGNDEIHGGTGNDVGIIYTNNAEAFVDPEFVSFDVVTYFMVKAGLFGGAGHDRLYGEAGNDTLYGEAGRDRLYGGTGNDRLNGGSDVDLLYGQGGNDTYIVDSLDRIYETASGGRDRVEAASSFKLARYVETLKLTGERDIDGTGNDGDNLLTGNTATTSCPAVAVAIS